MTERRRVVGIAAMALAWILLLSLLPSVAAAMPQTSTCNRPAGFAHRLRPGIVRVFWLKKPAQSKRAPLDSGTLEFKEARCTNKTATGCTHFEPGDARYSFTLLPSKSVDLRKVLPGRYFLELQGAPTPYSVMVLMSGKSADKPTELILGYNGDCDLLLTVEPQEKTTGKRKAAAPK